MVQTISRIRYVNSVDETGYGPSSGVNTVLLPTLVQFGHELEHKVSNEFDARYWTTEYLLWCPAQVIVDVPRGRQNRFVSYS